VRYRLWVRLLTLAIALGTMPALAQEPATPAAVEVGPTRQVAVLTGSDSINETAARWGVNGTDLGHTFEHDAAVYMIFGDTFGRARSDWRSNVAAVITDDDPSDGLTFDRMIEDKPGHAGVLVSQSMVPGIEVTIIPTYGVSIGDRMVLHYMAVKKWGNPGHWDLDHSGLAYSDDDGQTWTVDENAIWPGDSNFGQVSIVEVGDRLYFFGIPGGRFGGVQIARVGPEQILDLDAYEYWDGAAWAADTADAKTVLPAPVGELSVRWNAYYQKWVMMYLNEDKYAIVLRTADCLLGPWSEEAIVVTGEQFPQHYAPFMLPKWNDGPEIYFTMSLFGPYDVSLMQTSLTDVRPSSADPECVKDT
jgi:hypothetical protein